MQIVIDIPEAIYNTAKHTNILEANADALAECIRNGTVLPDNPTNGDMIKAMFPNGIKIDKSTAYAKQVTEDWWNEKYKAKEQEK